MVIYKDCDTESIFALLFWIKLSEPIKRQKNPEHKNKIKA